MSIGENSPASMLAEAPMKYRSHMEGGDNVPYDSSIFLIGPYNYGCWVNFGVGLMTYS